MAKEVDSACHMWTSWKLKAHLGPKTQIQDALRLDETLRLYLHDTSVLIGRHNGYAHTKCICNCLKSDVIAPCAKLLHALTILLIVFRYVILVQVWTRPELVYGCCAYEVMLIRCPIKLI